MSSSWHRPRRVLTFHAWLLRTCDSVFKKKRTEKAFRMPVSTLYCGLGCVVVARELSHWNTTTKLFVQPRRVALPGTSQLDPVHRTFVLDIGNYCIVIQCRVMWTTITVHFRIR
jgi:hypothetical protein